jgi:hypothetical protein
MDTNEEILSQPKADRKAEKASIREASAKLQDLLKRHLAARSKGAEVSPLRAMAERIKAKEQAGGGMQP